MNHVETDETDVNIKNAKMVLTSRAAKTAPKKRRKRQLRKVPFNLDAADEREGEALAYLQSLTKSRKRNTFIREAVLLMMALEDGDVNTLLNLYPHVYDVIAEDAIAQQDESDSVAVRMFSHIVDKAAREAMSKLPLVSASGITFEHDPLPELKSKAVDVEGAGAAFAASLSDDDDDW